MKNWKYLLISLVAVLVLMMVGGIALADEVSEPAVVDEALIARTPVKPLFKNGRVTVYADNRFLTGNFFVTYSVNYHVTDGIYTATASSATLDSFAVTIEKGDFYGTPYVTHNLSRSGLLTLIVNYQVKRVEADGTTEYSGWLQARTSIQLPAQ